MSPLKSRATCSSRRSGSRLPTAPDSTRIVDLRPGTYVVTFKLTGFSAVRREGIELTGVATAAVNAELRIGTLEETITVSAESPIVDVQSVRRQTTVSGDVLNVLPTARGYGAVMQLIPSLTTQSSFTPGARDVQVTPGMQVFGGQGGRENEGRLQVDGIGTGAPVNGGGVSGYIADVVNAQEVAFTTSGGLGEAEVGGPTMTIVPKTGGNTVKGTFYAAGVNNSMVSSNYTDAFAAAGLGVPGELLKLWDFSVGVGGPIVRNRLWYFGNIRNEGIHRSVPGMHANKNAGDPTKRFYEADLTRQSRSAQAYQIQNLRLTIQATPRNKIGLFWDEQIPCNGATWSEDIDGCRRQSSSGFIYGGTATIAPEAGGTGAGGTSGGYVHKFQRVQQATWSSPVTSRLLLEAGFGTYLARYGSNEVPGNPTRDMVRVSEQCTAGCAVNGGIAGLIYRAHDWEYNWNGAHRWRASGTYVTGAHSMKFGYEGAFLAYEPMAFTNNLGLSYQVNNGIPNQLTQRLDPFQRLDHVEYAGVLRPGTVDARPDDAAGSPAIRPGVELVSRADRRRHQVPADAAGVPGNRRRHRVQRRHAAARSGLRPVRERQDVAEGERRPVPRSGRGARRVFGAESGDADIHPGHPGVHRWEQQLRAGLRSR